MIVDDHVGWVGSASYLSGRLSAGVQSDDGWASVTVLAVKWYVIS